MKRRDAHVDAVAPAPASAAGRSTGGHGSQIPNPPPGIVISSGLPVRRHRLGMPDRAARLSGRPDLHVGVISPSTANRHRHGSRELRSRWSNESLRTSKHSTSGSARTDGDAVAGAAVHRRPLDRGPGLLPGRPVPGVQRHPERPDAALGRDDRRGRRVPAARRLRQRPHRRPPGPAGQLRARQPPGHPHRARRHRSPCSPTATRASGSTAPTTSSSGPTARSGSPIRATASTATTRATRPTSEIGALPRLPRRPGHRRGRASSPTTSCGPNGLAFSADERQLYIVDTRAQAHPACSTSPTTARCPAARSSPTCDAGAFDGLRLDEAGRVWAAAHDGLHCFDPDGTLIGKLHVPEIVSNLTFGGPKRNQLFISATTSVYCDPGQLQRRALSLTANRPDAIWAYDDRSTVLVWADRAWRADHRAVLHWGHRRPERRHRRPDRDPGRQPEDEPDRDPNAESTEDPPHPVSLQALMAKEYDGRGLRVGRVLARTATTRGTSSPTGAAS